MNRNERCRVWEEGRGRGDRKIWKEKRQGINWRGNAVTWVVFGQQIYPLYVLGYYWSDVVTMVFVKFCGKIKAVP